MALHGNWRNIVGSSIVHFFHGEGNNAYALCDYNRYPRDGSEGRHCKRCERVIIAEEKRREKEILDRRELLERIDYMNNSTALDRLIELVGEGASDYGYSGKDDSIERDELEKAIRYRLAYYVHGEE